MPAPEGGDGSHIRFIPGDQRPAAGSHRGREKRQRERSEGIRSGLPRTRQQAGGGKRPY